MFRLSRVDQAKRRADLRLDEKASAYVERDGVRAVVPGQPEASELVAQIFRPTSTR